MVLCNYSDTGGDMWYCETVFAGRHRNNSFLALNAVRPGTFVVRLGGRPCPREGPALEGGWLCLAPG